MSCRPDLGILISEIEWLVKNHSNCISGSSGRSKPPSCEDECHTIKITLDIFVKLHQMLHNYIGLLNFRGPKSRDFTCFKIPQNEALDVAVRAMISAMQSSNPKQFSTPICPDCTRTSECCKGQSTNSRTNCNYDIPPEIEEVDKKLLRLKFMPLESFENVELHVKDILNGITKLPLNVMTSRLEILSSVVRNRKNRLTSCGHPSAGFYVVNIVYCANNSQCRHVNSLSVFYGDHEFIQFDSISNGDTSESNFTNYYEFIMEYGQIKSKIYPCRKICRFCNSEICQMDRQRNIFCCENARHLNFLWKEWIGQNSIKGVAKWDEDTIMSIVDSFKDVAPPVEENRCNPGARCATLFTTGRQLSSRRIVQNGEGDDRKSERKYTNERGERGGKSLSQGEGRGLDNRLRNQKLRESEIPSKISRSRTGEKRDVKGPEKDGNFRTSQKLDMGKEPETNAHDSRSQSAGERRISGASDFDKTTRRKRRSRKDKGEVDLDDQDRNPRIRGRRNKGSRNEEGEPNKTEGDLLDRENKRRGRSRKKIEGDFFDRSGDQGIGNMGIRSHMESSKKGQDPKIRAKIEKGYEDGREMDDVTFHGRGDRNSTRETEVGRSDIKNGDSSPGTTKTREKYAGEDYDDGKRKISSEEERRVKSGKSTSGDSENIIRYQLSNELFVELGWTLLPKDSIMRRVVEFQALLAKPHMNWFKKNQIHGKQYYPDEKTVFIDFLENGSGEVRYPNGQTAIAAQISKKGTHELYKVYGLGGRDVMGVVRPPRLMGVFDSMGNGVVYDENCDLRLTYNQNGGIYIGNPTKVSFSWGWTNFQTSPTDEAVYKDPICAQVIPPELTPSRELKVSSSKASKQSKLSRATSSGKCIEDQTMSENQKSKIVEPMKVIPRKIITPLKPVCLKLNKFLSLRILDRKNINLQFFAGSKCVRIELGTEVNPNVQINSELVDRDDWTANMNKSRFHVDLKKNDLNKLSPDNSLLEIAEEFQRAKIEANTRQLMIAKYRPNLISPFSPRLPG